MKAVSCQNGGRGLPSCSRDWALRFTLRSLNWGAVLRASRTNLMSRPMSGGSSSWNFRETWTTSLGRREGVARLLGLSLGSMDLEVCLEGALGPSRLQLLKSLQNHLPLLEGTWEDRAQNQLWARLTQRVNLG